MARSWSTLAVVVAGIGLSAAGYWTARDLDDRRLRDSFSLQVQAAIRDIERLVDAGFLPLEAAAIFVDSQDDLQADEFTRFARQALLLNETARTIIWAPRVTAAGRSRFEAEARSGNPSFQIFELDGERRVPAMERPDYAPVLAGVVQDGMPPLSGHGFDLLSEPRRRDAALAARDQGRARATSIVPTVTTAEPVFVVFRPVYSGGRVPAAGPDRSRLLRGFVVSTFAPAAVFRQAFGGLSNLEFDIECGLLTAATGSSGRIVPVGRYDHRTKTFADGDGPSPAAPAADGSMSFTGEFAASGQTWRLAFTAPPPVVDVHRSTSPGAWLVTGLAITVFLAGFLERRRRRMTTISRAVEERTADLRRANRDMNTLIDASPLAIISLDAECRVRSWNPAAERTFGYTAAEVMGQRYALVPDGEWSAFQVLFDKVAQGAVLRDISVQRRHKDGRIIDIVFSGGPLYAEDGAFAGAVYVLEDVTDKLKSEVRLVQAQKMEAVGQLTGGVAHDFNNILTVIVGNVDQIREVLDAQPDGAPDRSFLTALADTTMKASMRGAELVRHLLAFSRNQPLLPKPLDVRAVVQGVEPLLRRAIGERIRIEARLAPAVWPVMADESQLGNAILNLAINARDAMPGGGQLTIAAANASLDADAAALNDMPEGDFVALAVCDTGTGIAPDVLLRVFEPFFTTKPEGKGTGLGLSMVYGFARQSGGSVKIYSEPGHGTEVRIYLPRAAGAEDQAAAESGDAEAPLPRGGERILVVEDKEDVRDTVRAVLAGLGYDVATAAGGRAALDLVDRDGGFDLLFTDLVMPGELGGLELAREMRRRFPGLPIVFTSGFSEPAGLREETAALGASVIGKPYRRAQLARHLRRALDRRPLAADDD